MRNDYRNAIRDLIHRNLQQNNIQNLIVWEIKEDESQDPSLLSYKLYGSRTHIDAVLVACGANGIWEKLPLLKVAFPRLVDLLRLQKEYLQDN
ncbi:hypothetical protein [Acinetobacter lactucae]|uniref:Uncharacterized protein n=1 Tax=Acinetobacter lactucae TaxID=1785128 RepID=R8YVC0_9GAMM|nr:hypothetical protein [Acinetobacter lactucae]EOQ73031.1 hypothetical protein F929_02966 [Acinetobacter lactucae]